MINTQIIDIDKQENSDGSSGSVSTFAEPVTLTDVKNHLIITSTDDDSYLQILISACRATIEQFCHISIVEKIITLTTMSSQRPVLKWGPMARYYETSGKDYSYYEKPEFFELPEGPVQSIISVSTINSNGSTSTLLLDTDYYVRGKSFKTVYINNSYINNIFIYMAGYDPTKIPFNLKLAILNEIAFRYELRGSSLNRYASQNTGLCEPAEYLAAPFKRMAWQ